MFNAEAIATYTPKLADRIEHHVRAGDFPVVLGGDCSIQLGASLASAASGGTDSPSSTGPRTSGTPGTPTVSVPRAVKSWPSPPAAARRT